MRIDFRSHSRGLVLLLLYPRLHRPLAPRAVGCVRLVVQEAHR